MYTMYKDGESVQVDKDQVADMQEGGWSLVAPEQPVVDVEKEVKQEETPVVTPPATEEPVGNTLETQSTPETEIGSRRK